MQKAAAQLCNSTRLTRLGRIEAPKREGRRHLQIPSLCHSNFNRNIIRHIFQYILPGGVIPKSFRIARSWNGTKPALIMYNTSPTIHPVVLAILTFRQNSHDVAHKETATHRLDQIVPIEIISPGCFNRKREITSSHHRNNCRNTRPLFAGKEAAWLAWWSMIRAYHKCAPSN